jgi:2-dehydro-3-deoxyphosphogluconate aldolase/(4S)-4-hydroxy-2-oxoglutarate aldolase
MSEISSIIKQYGIVPLITVNSGAEGVNAAKALVAGGIPIAEITFRSDAAIEAFKAVSKNVPEVLLLAGTCKTLDQTKAAVEAGCKGIVTPALNVEIVKWCLANNIPVYPGTMTARDILDALNLGLTELKFFPASIAGGPKALKALNGPFSEAEFLPTGGVSIENAKEYYDLKNVFAVGGSFPVPSKDPDEIIKACQDSLKAIGK